MGIKINGPLYVLLRAKPKDADGFGAETMSPGAGIFPWKA